MVIVRSDQSAAGVARLAEGGVDQSLAAIADAFAGAHGVGAIAECDVGVGVGEAEGAAKAGVPVACGVGAHGHVAGAVEVEAEGHAKGAIGEAAGVVPTLGAEEVDGFGAQDVSPIDRAAEGERGEKSGNGAGVAVAVGGGEFDAAKLLRVVPVGLLEEGAPGAVELGVRIVDGVGGGAIGVWLKVDGAGDLFVVEAEGVIEAERRGDLLAKEGADGAAVDAANQLAHQMPVGRRVIGADRARLPGRGLAFQGINHDVPVPERIRGREVGVDKSGVVGDELLDGNVLFAGLDELRPVMGDGFRDVEFAAIDQHVGADGRDAFADGHHADNGVLIPGLGALGIFVATPEVDDFAAIVVDADGSPEFVAVGEIFGERPAHGGEGLVAASVDERFSWSAHRGSRRTPTRTTWAPSMDDRHSLRFSVEILPSERSRRFTAGETIV